MTVGAEKPASFQHSVPTEIRTRLTHRSTSELLRNLNHVSNRSTLFEIFCAPVECENLSVHPQRRRWLALQIRETVSPRVRKGNSKYVCKHELNVNFRQLNHNQITALFGIFQNCAATCIWMVYFTTNIYKNLSSLQFFFCWYSLPTHVGLRQATWRNSVVVMDTGVLRNHWNNCYY